MTFAALAKTFTRFTSSSSASSVASSSRSLQRSKLSSTPPTEVKSDAEVEEVQQEESSREEGEIEQVKEQEEPVEPIAEAKEEKEQTEQNAAPLLASKSVTEPEGRTEEYRDGIEAANIDGDDEGEDMDIASSRGSTPEPIIISREALNVSGGVGLQTPKARSTPPLPNVGNGAVGQAMQTSLEKENRPIVATELKAMDRMLPVLDRKMSDTELDQAKCLILDLLGWGVPPEYLLERGISHALIYTVFLDLRLRLPGKIMNECRRLAD